MGEFTGVSLPSTEANRDMNINTGRQVSDTNDDNSHLKTDIPDLYADDVVKKGTETYPVFDVDSQTFYSNQRADRKRIRFKVGSKAAQYMQKTRTGNKPFYIRTTGADGVKYTRKLR